MAYKMKQSPINFTEGDKGKDKVKVTSSGR